MKTHFHSLLLFLLLSTSLSFQVIQAVDFVLNSFNSSNMLLYGSARIESGVIRLTNDTTMLIGRALYRSKIPTKMPNSSFVYPFSVSFIFSITPDRDTLPGHGIVFLFVPFTGIQGSNTASQNLGFMNRTSVGDPKSHKFGVEFDVFKNEEFDDIDDNHVGVDVNSLKSKFVHTAGYYQDKETDDDEGEDDEKSFKKLKLNNGKNYQVWIDYSDAAINVTMAPVGEMRPRKPLLSAFLNLSDVLEDEMYVGFTSSTGQLVESHRILSWSFSNSNFSLSEKLITTGLPSFSIPASSVFRSKGFIAGITVGSFLVIVIGALLSLLLIKRKRRKRRLQEEMEDWELEYWPHRMTYSEIERATNGFSEENVIGIGGNGKVYKGVLEGGAEVAVKRMSHENREGIREFLAEITSLGRLKHRNLVRMRGWCKKERGVFMLVYDYMENGSLDKWLFEIDENNILSCAERIRILKDIASGVLYLHEGWEARVLHRDIKASNVLLDKEMNGKLADFGLARMHEHGQVPNTSRVVGTVGYLAPEVIKAARASAQTDVFGFGVLILEVMCGRRPVEDGKPPLVDLVRQLMVQGELLNALDPRLRTRGEVDQEEVERVLHLGLLCTYPEPNSRPFMRQVVKLLEGKNRNDLPDSEIEDMNASLLQNMMHSLDMSSIYRPHPTIEDVQQVNSSSGSVLWSNSLIEGR